MGSVQRDSTIGLSLCDERAGGLPRPTPRCAPIAALTHLGGAEDQPWQQQAVRCWGDSASGPWYGCTAPDPTLSRSGGGRDEQVGRDGVAAKWSERASVATHRAHLVLDPTVHVAGERDGCS
eukprot:2078742-Rhodomonas_salina.1